MEKIIFVLAFTAFFSCNNSTNNQAATSNDTNNNKDSAQQTVTVADSSQETAPNADSIDQANRNTIADAKGDINKAYVSLKDSVLEISYNKSLDHRFFGYAQPDTNSKRMILLSDFTGDVESNPFGCPYGAYYQTSDMENMQLKYRATEGNFAKFAIIKNNTLQDTVYIQKQWIELEK